MTFYALSWSLWIPDVLIHTRTIVVFTTCCFWSQFKTSLLCCLKFSEGKYRWLFFVYLPPSPPTTHSLPPSPTMHVNVRHPTKNRLWNLKMYISTEKGTVRYQTFTQDSIERGLRCSDFCIFIHPRLSYVSGLFKKKFHNLFRKQSFGKWWNGPKE